MLVGDCVGGIRVRVDDVFWIGLNILYFYDILFCSRLVIGFLRGGEVVKRGKYK